MRMWEKIASTGPIVPSGSVVALAAPRGNPVPATGGCAGCRRGSSPAHIWGGASSPLISPRAAEGCQGVCAPRRWRPEDLGEKKSLNSPQLHGKLLGPWVVLYLGLRRRRTTPWKGGEVNGRTKRTCKSRGPHARCRGARADSDGLEA